MLVANLPLHHALILWARVSQQVVPDRGTYTYLFSSISSLLLGNERVIDKCHVRILLKFSSAFRELP